MAIKNEKVEGVEEILVKQEVLADLEGPEVDFQQIEAPETEENEVVAVKTEHIVKGEILVKQEVLADLEAPELAGVDFQQIEASEAAEVDSFEENEEVVAVKTEHIVKEEILVKQEILEDLEAPELAGVDFQQIEASEAAEVDSFEENEEVVAVKTEHIVKEEILFKQEAPDILDTSETSEIDFQQDEDEMAVKSENENLVKQELLEEVVEVSEVAIIKDESMAVKNDPEELLAKQVLSHLTHFFKSEQVSTLFNLVNQFILLLSCFYTRFRLGTQVRYSG
jgi:hypothetical protein